MRACEATSVDSTGSCCLLVWTRAHKRIMCPGVDSVTSVWVLVARSGVDTMDGVNRCFEVIFLEGHVLLNPYLKLLIDSSKTIRIDPHAVLHLT
jgi:hypothetical protein